jgi:hypothetical protein
MRNQICASTIANISAYIRASRERVATFGLMASMSAATAPIHGDFDTLNIVPAPSSARRFVSAAIVSCETSKTNATAIIPNNTEGKLIERAKKFGLSGLGPGTVPRKMLIAVPPREFRAKAEHRHKIRLACAVFEASEAEVVVIRA